MCTCMASLRKRPASSHSDASSKATRYSSIVVAPRVDDRRPSNAIFLEMLPAFPNRLRSSAQGDSTPVSENISSSGIRRAKILATPFMAAVRVAACLPGGTEVRRIQMATSAHHERKPVGLAKGGVLVVVLETAATAAARAASSMSADASPPDRRADVALCRPSGSPFPTGR